MSNGRQLPSSTHRGRAPRRINPGHIGRPRLVRDLAELSADLAGTARAALMPADEVQRIFYVPPQEFPSWAKYRYGPEHEACLDIPPRGHYNPFMPDHDVLYDELLETIQAGGCPLCRLGQRASDSYLHALIYEGVTDPALRHQLRDARGPCARHAWRLARQRGAVLGTAILYRDFVNTLTKALEASSDAPRRLFGRTSDADAGLAPTAECPACTLEADATGRTAKTLLKHLDKAELEQAYIAAGGLCMPHLRLTLSLASGGSAKTLSTWQATAWRRLRDELDELIRKHDHRFQSEKITEDEATAWERAVAAVVGEEATRDETNATF